MRADAYFFDIDGTLLVTRDLVHWNALHQAMVEVYGIDTTIAGLPYHGKTDIAILRMALNRCGVPDSEFYSRLPLVLEVVCREVAAHAHSILPEVCPAIPEVLSAIRERNGMLGVASGNLASVGWNKLTAARLDQFFSLSSFGDRHEQRSAIFDEAVMIAKTALGNHARVCFVGDTPDDIKAARRVDALVVAVSTGTFRFHELALFAPDACCTSCIELLHNLD